MATALAMAVAMVTTLRSDLRLGSLEDSASRAHSAMALALAMAMAMGPARSRDPDSAIRWRTHTPP